MITQTAGILTGAVSLIGFVIFFFIGYLNSRISRLSDSLHKRIYTVESHWRNSETCEKIHNGLNGDIAEIKADIKEIYKILREK